MAPRMNLTLQEHLVLNKEAWPNLKQTKPAMFRGARKLYMFIYRGVVGAGWLTQGYIFLHKIETVPPQVKIHPQLKFFILTLHYLLHMTISVTTLKQYIQTLSFQFVSLSILWKGVIFFNFCHQATIFFYLPLLLLIENQKVIPKYVKIQNCSPHFGAQKQKYTPPCG